MRSIALSTLLISGLASLSLATGCKSDKPTAATETPAELASAEGTSAGGQPAEETPALPVPRRMRGSESADGDAGPGAGRWRGERREEMRQRVEEARKRFDADGDGQLSDDERSAMRHQRLQRQIQRIDTDADGKISREEAEATPFGGRMLGDFEGADANQDSFISPEELEAAMSDRQSQRMERWRQRREERGAEPAPPASR